MRAPALAALVLAALGAVLLTGGRPDAAPTSRKAQEAILPQAVAPAFAPPRPRALSGKAQRSWWAPVRQAVVARVRPDGAAPAVARLDLRTPEGTANLVAVVGRPHTRAGRQWTQVQVATLPRNRPAWVPRRALGALESVDTHLTVDRGRRTATLLKGGRVVFRARVGVGRPGSPTPAGRFYVRDKLTRFRSPTYGPVAFGTSARSATLTDWPAGGFVGLHGTDRPELLPGAVSHGCIRFANADIRRLARLMPVGTALTIT